MQDGARKPCNQEYQSQKKLSLLSRDASNEPLDLLYLRHMITFFLHIHGLKLFLDLSSKQKDFNQKFSAQFAITGIQYTVCEF